MLSRVLRATPRLARTAHASRSLHASAARRDLIQDLYSSEIKAFKPRQLSDKDAEGTVLKWAVPTAPQVPGEEVSVSDVDAYASAPVETEDVAAAAEGGAAPAPGADWFPIESSDELDGDHH